VVSHRVLKGRQRHQHASPGRLAAATPAAGGGGWALEVRARTPLSSFSRLCMEGAAQSCPRQAQQRVPTALPATRACRAGLLPASSLNQQAPQAGSRTDVGGRDQRNVEVVSNLQGALGGDRPVGRQPSGG